MNMHKTIDGGAIDDFAMAKCAYDMMLVAIGMIDETTVPGDVGAHADLAIHKLGRWLCNAPHVAQLGSLQPWTIDPQPD